MQTAYFGRAFLLGTALILGGCGDCEAPDSPPNGDEASLRYLAQLEAAPYQIGIIRELGEYEVARFRAKATGDVYAIFGGKDEAGQVVEIQRMTRTDSAGVTTTVDYQPNGNRSFTGAKGIQLDVKREDGRWLAEFRDPDSGTSFRTVLPNPGVAAAPSGAGRPLNLALGQPSAANQIIANVTTSNCGSLADPLGQRVFVQFNDGLGALLGRYPAQRTGPGAYRAAVPDPDKQAGISFEFLKSALTAATEALDVVCKFDSANPMLLPTSCLYISEQMALTGIGAPLAVDFLALCDTAVVILKAACAIEEAINLPTPPAVSDSGAEVIKKTQNLLIDKLPNQIAMPTLRALAEGLPADTYGPPVELAPGDSAVSLALDLFRLSVGDIVLAPPAPAAPNQYTASAALQCLAPGTSAVIEVRGSDGYFNQQQQSFSSVTNAATISLVVPGADQAGIRDTLTLTVTPSDAPAVTRKAYLVFQ